MTQIITIDGPAASGKGTLARRLADHLNYFYLDTGKFYRLVGLEAKAKGIVPEDDRDKVVEIAKNLANTFTLDMMDNPQLKSDTAGQMASRVAPHAPLRQAILDLQRTLAHTPPQGLKGAVLDGRDCGTVICPDAKHKFFITASTETRAKRRFAELESMGDDTSYEDVFADMKERDDRDANRTEAPMKPAENAIVIDTSMLTANQAFELVLENLQMKE